jgi:predicted permease
MGARLHGLALLAWPVDVRRECESELRSGFDRLVASGRRRGRVAGALAVIRGLSDVVAGGIRFRLRPSLRRALLSGGRDGVNQETNVRSWGSMATLTADIRYAVRTLVRQPVFALTAMVTLGLGIGANTAVFSIVYGLLFRPFPYEDADRLVMLWSGNPERGWTRTDVSPADVEDWRGRTSVFSDVAVIGRSSLNLSGDDRPERLEAQAVTANVFGVLRTPPVIGRDFEVSDDRPGAAATAILTWGLWQRRFAGDPAVVGRTLNLDEEAHTVIGVLPREFVAFEGAPEVFVPLRQTLSEVSRTAHAYMAIGRLLPGVTFERANRDVAAVAATLAAEYPETNEGWTGSVVSLRDDVVGPVGMQTSAVLTGAVAFVLLMACVNVANLLLARANGRRRELAIRTALGAGRSRVIRQLLTESLLLAVGGAAVGVFLAYFGVQAIVATLSGTYVPALFTFGVDPAVLAYALGVAVVATLLFGLVPAIRSSSASSVELREEGRTGEGRRSKRFGGSLVVMQTALAVVLLVGGGMMMRSVAAMHSQDLGYDTADVLTLRLSPPDAKYPDTESLDRFYDDVLARVRAQPGVRSAGTIQSLPLRGSNSVNTYTIAGESSPESSGYPARMGYVSTGYFEAMGIRIVRGRTIAETDTEDAPAVALVNETLARQRFGDADPIGRVVSFSHEDHEIVGVVVDMRERSLLRDPEPSIYVPVAQSPVRSRNIAIRTTADPAALAQVVQRQVLAVDPTLPAYQVQPMSALFEMRIAPFRLIAGMMLAFAAVSLLLGAVGIYGVTSYAVGRRTTEIGIRMAIGAERSSVVRMIVREGLVRATIGVAIGLTLAVPLSFGLQGLLVGVNPGDPLTFAAVAVVLVLVTFLGAWLPARRAAKLDPVRALSHG